MERTLMNARNDATCIKFNGKLEIETETEMGELDKEQFVAALKDKAMYHGQQTFYYLPNMTGTMTSLLDNYHAFTVKEVIFEYKSRLEEPKQELINDVENQDSRFHRFTCYDELEIDELALSQLLVESLLTQAFREQLQIWYSHYANFLELPGQVIFMMTLDTCNASAEMDVDAAKEKFKLLSLNDFPGENVMDFATSALKLIKILKGDYVMNTTVGSTLVKKVAGSSSEYFNRQMHALLDQVKPFESKYKLRDPKLLTQDPLYSSLGPFGLCGKIQDEYGKLCAEREWPALAMVLPEANQAQHQEQQPPPADDRNQDRQTCYNCNKVGHIGRFCPHDNNRNNNGNGGGRGHGGGYNGNNGGGRAFGRGGRGNGRQDGGGRGPGIHRHPKAPWKYIHPADPEQTVELHGVTWKFCGQCVCLATQKVGYYNLSHTTSGHTAAQPGGNHSAVIDDIAPASNIAAETSDDMNAPQSPGPAVAPQVDDNVPNPADALEFTESSECGSLQ